MSNVQCNGLLVSVVYQTNSAMLSQQNKVEFKYSDIPKSFSNSALLTRAPHV